MKMLAVDTEDNSRGRVYLINFYDGVRHATFRDRESAWRFLDAQGPAVVWACNMEYDLINLFGPWVGKMCTLQYVRSGLLKAFYKDGPVQFYDTLRHWPASVAEMGRHLGLPKLAADFRSVRYCRRDTEIVWRFVDAMLAQYVALGLRIKPTLPAMALQYWRQLYGRPVPELPRGVRQLCRAAYFGGRVEVFRTGVVRGPIQHYDVNSLFPYVMARYAYPALHQWAVTTRPRWTREGVCACTVDVPPTRYPTLPVRERDGLMFPTGRLTGTWAYPELRQAMRDGARVVSVNEAVEFSRTERPFAEYVRRCYAARLAARTPLEKFFFKGLMNTLYGKFGQSGGLTMIVNDREVEVGGEASHANVIWSVYVTSYARLHLLRYLRRCGEDVFYTDTDSLFTTTRFPTSTALGALKLEGVWVEGEWKGNKLYVVAGATGAHAKAKGVPRAAALDFVRTGRAVFRRPARLKESRRRGTTPNRWYTVEKRAEAVYNKRRVLPHGGTEPWDYQTYLTQPLAPR